VEELNGVRTFSHHFTLVPRMYLDRVRDWIESERSSEQSAADVVRANVHRLHRIVAEMAEGTRENLTIVTAEGDPLEFRAATYKVKDEEALRNALHGMPDLEADGDGFVWSEPSGEEGQRRSLGNIVIRKGKLTLECMSRERLKRGRKLIEGRAGALLDFTSERELSAAPVEESKKSSGIPPEVQREAALRMKTQHYAGWAEVPLPALDGISPREAVKTPEGRRRVEELLRMMENGEAHEKKRGGAAFDFTPIRESLGL
jgi:hypothetical protein